MGESLAADRCRFHLQGRDADRLGRRDALGKTVELPVVHQESDSAAVHPEHRPWPIVLEHRVQRVEHEAVAAQRDQSFGLLGRRESVARAEHRFRLIGDVGAR